MASNALISVNYKVYGRVQGVFFRKHTRDTALKSGLVGWVRNEPDDTVTGVVQGPVDKVQLMKVWLKTKGSPSSEITKCEFTKERKISKLEFDSFTVEKYRK